jgi:hypothetical protein
MTRKQTRTKKSKAKANVSKAKETATSKDRNSDNWAFKCSEALETYEFNEYFFKECVYLYTEGGQVEGLIKLRTKKRYSTLKSQHPKLEWSAIGEGHGRFKEYCQYFKCKHKNKCLNHVYGVSQKRMVAKYFTYNFISLISIVFFNNHYRTIE